MMRNYPIMVRKTDADCHEKIKEKEHTSIKTCNNSKKAFPVSILEITKTNNKHIACGPAGVVQHRLLTGSYLLWAVFLLNWT